MTVLSSAFFGESDRINKLEFNKALKQLPDISVEERQYLNQVFAKDLKGGLTNYELKKRIERLRRNKDDSIDSQELKNVKKKLLSEFWN